MLKIGLIVGSTRPNRFADHPVQWIVEGAKARTDLQVEVLDLREFALPFFDEAVPPAMNGGTFSDPKARAWGAKLAGFDGFIATAAEYNHAMTAVLKNALDSAYNEWIKKPIAFVGYGGAGGARAIEQLRLAVINLQMAPVNAGVNISFPVYLEVLQGKGLASFDHLNQSRTGLFNELVWWGEALKAARG